MDNLTISKLRLDLPLKGSQIEEFRKVFAANFGHNDLVHNHDSEGMPIQRYPLIQYRVRHGKAQIIGIGEGSDLLLKILSLYKNGEIKFKEWPFQSVNVLKFDSDPIHITYSEGKNWNYVSQWLALRDQSYLDWLNAQNLVERIAILENRLAAHLLSFCRAVGFRAPGLLGVEIQQIIKTRQIKYKNNPFVAFDVVYSSKLKIPAGIGIGHGVSHGFGISTPVKSYNTSTQEEEFVEVILSGLESHE